MEIRKINTENRVNLLLSFIESTKYWHYDPFFDLFVIFCLCKCDKKKQVESFFVSLENKINQIDQVDPFFVREDNVDFFNCFSSSTWKAIVLPLSKGIYHYFKKEYQQSFDYMEKIFLGVKINFFLLFYLIFFLIFNLIFIHFILHFFSNLIFFFYFSLLKLISMLAMNK